MKIFKMGRFYFSRKLKLRQNRICKNNNKHKVTLRTIYNKRDIKKFNKNTEFIDLNKKYDINNIVIKDDIYEPKMQLIKYIPNTLLEDFKTKYKKKIKNLKKRKNKKLKKNKENIYAQKIEREPIYDGYNYFLNVKTYTYIKSPFNNIEFKCIKWNLYRPKSEVTLVVEDKNNNKYKHVLKYEDFRKLLLNEFQECVVDDYLCS